MRWSWVQAKRWNYPQPNMSRNFDANFGVHLITLYFSYFIFFKWNSSMFAKREVQSLKKLQHHLKHNTEES